MPKILKPDRSSVKDWLNRTEVKNSIYVALTSGSGVGVIIAIALALLGNAEAIFGAGTLAATVSYGLVQTIQNLRKLRDGSDDGFSRN